MDRDSSFVERHYRALALAVLCLAAFNLTFRLGHEIVTEWDESLYATSAWEMLHNHNWVATTFMRSLDYYNTKPPLNVWLIALSFKLFGPSLISLRLPAIIAAWFTIALLQWWTRQTLGAKESLIASAILATTFGFMYDHAARSGNTDALFTLLILLAVISLWAARDHPWRLVWLGPVAAAVFLLRGMAVLMPLAIVATAEIWRVGKGRALRAAPLAVAAVVAAVPIAAWVVARWRIDQWRFLSRIVTYDFAARILTVIEDHPGTPLYYLNILQRNQYDWVLGGTVALVLSALSWRSIARALAFWRADNETMMLMASWGVLSFLIPTIMRTKLSWYLVPFYVPFAVAIAFLFVRSFAVAQQRQHRVRLVGAAMVFVFALTAAEGRLLWYSFHRRALENSSQGLLLAQRTRLGGRKVFRRHWTHSEMFVLTGIVGAEHREAANLDQFLRDSDVGDFLFSSTPVEGPDVELVGSDGQHHLFRRVEQPHNP